MIYLKLFKGKKAINKKVEIREFATIEAAIKVGRRSGCAWVIDDPLQGKTFDSEEIELREEEDWYYDETEQLWKRIPGGRILKRMLSITVPLECFPVRSKMTGVCTG
ncbi:MAG: hypothetical protein WCP32_03125 [Bacteroidota bacterium]